MSSILELPGDSWTQAVPAEVQARAIDNLEEGRVLYFPHLAFALLPEEEAFLRPTWSSGGAKNIGFERETGKIWGVSGSETEKTALSRMLRRYADSTRDLLLNLFPTYAASLMQARTSFRPIEIAGRASSYRKDDTRLHVDAFPSRPTGGRRILRVFSNVNPEGKPRCWRIGEGFREYAQRFAPRVASPIPASRFLLSLTGVTKGYRSLYDHYMLGLHDQGKLDMEYQRQSPQEPFAFPPHTTWMCFTDQALHAVDSGQYLLEQTFHLPRAALRHPELSPLTVLEDIVGRPLCTPSR
ncbi:Kdo hydroxylase family protein [Methylacidimicrobium sp. B4]|uniref:Kdo hydroxylase family protein n=1 Tax=Methylacidimicrobium sp. B4 TaxID=2796139 RepID=UPI001A8F4B0B|nr:Kdo hydroxylase family protein [Methylacidimicrobium sp. B4]QSR84746.1 Kdo hydroxylase family protein [Methylacidimicrobium sp. B4]